jgi:putative hydrolase of HD superfamily
MLGAMGTLDALLALLPLERLPRTGWLTAGISAPESIAAHQIGTAYLALALASQIVPPVDADRCVTLALVHDAPEALLSDLSHDASALLPSGAKRGAEARAAQRLLEPLSALALERFNEVHGDLSREARFVHLCDKLQLGVRLVGYLRSGARGLEGFVPGLAALECGEFAPCERLRAEILERVRALGGGGP